MALRTFADSGGRVWEVWDVIPKAIAGRAEDRRRNGRRVDETQQSAFDRRQAERRASFSPAMWDGWLAFRCGEERRRLAPIPDGWTTADDPLLEVYCRGARVVLDGPRQFFARAPGEPSST
jgi:hypothetical protein